MHQARVFFFAPGPKRGQNRAETGSKRGRNVKISRKKWGRVSACCFSAVFWPFGAVSGRAKRLNTAPRAAAGEGRGAPWTCKPSVRWPVGRVSPVRVGAPWAIAQGVEGWPAGLSSRARQGAAKERRSRPSRAATRRRQAPPVRALRSGPPPALKKESKSPGSFSRGKSRRAKNLPSVNG